MTPPDLDRLEKVAEAATPAGYMFEHDFTFAFDPRTVLSLISSLRQAEAERDNLRHSFEAAQKDAAHSQAIATQLAADLAEAREALKVFGDRAAIWDGADEDGDPWRDDTAIAVCDPDSTNEGHDLTVGDFRRARALSSPGQKTEGA